MDLTTHLFVCFIGSAAVAITFNVPPRAIAICGVLGCVAWSFELYFQNVSELSLLASNFTAALIVALLAELAARLQHLPVNCYAVPGVIPLVPGFSAYNAMYGYVTGEMARADAALMQAILLAAAISAALVIAGSLVHLLPGHHRWRDPQDEPDATVAMLPPGSG